MPFHNHSRRFWLFAEMEVAFTNVRKSDKAM